jgi:hypothetical protein
LAASRRQQTFLATEEWMSVPWKSQPKTWRDKLYDLAISFNEIVVSSLKNDQTSNRREAIRTWVDQALQIEAEISTWHSSWFSEEYPHLEIECYCHSPAPFSCICSMPISKFSTNDFALLQVECWALQLLVSTTLRKLLTTETGFTASWIAHLTVRSSQIAYLMEAAFIFSMFKQTAKPSSGVTEGICRAVFPNWALREYRGIKESNGC